MLLLSLLSKTPSLSSSRSYSSFIPSPSLSLPLSTTPSPFTSASALSFIPSPSLSLPLSFTPSPFTSTSAPSFIPSPSLSILLSFGSMLSAKLSWSLSSIMFGVLFGSKGSVPASNSC